MNRWRCYACCFCFALLPLSRPCLHNFDSVFIFRLNSDSLGLFAFLARCGGATLPSKACRIYQKRGHSFVKNINAQEGLNLNPNEMLGYPSPTFCVFDKNNRKLAICNSVTKDWQVRDFDYVLQWYYEWERGTRMDVGAGGAALPKTNVRGPAISHSEYKRISLWFWKLPMKIIRSLNFKCRMKKRQSGGVQSA